MKLLYESCKEKEKRLIEHITNQVCGDYIYDYPPRQAYRRFDSDFDYEKVIVQSFDMSDELNLYFHFPFCKQICSYCNLFAVCDTNPEHFKEYFEILEKELDYYLPYISQKKINTIYLGGGTPSWISASMFRDFFDMLERKLNVCVKDVIEVSVEMSPDTTQPEHLRQYVEAGINRVNIGVQAVDNGELSCIGRHYSEQMIFQALSNVMSAGFDNVCVDLIYGLEGQSMDSWKRSLEMVVSYEPPTICPYPLTLRDNTGFSARGYLSLDGCEQYDKYEYARDFLLDHGYIQETHVRFKKIDSHGGYVQKENHWKQQNILGLGAGARSYLKLINYRNGYSVMHRKKAYNQYIGLIREKGCAIIDGFAMNQDERMRKMLVLGLNGLSIDQFEMEYGMDPLKMFPNEFSAMLKLNLFEVIDNHIVLTQKGVKYRDLIVQLFFSDNVNRLVYEHSYNE